MPALLQVGAEIHGYRVLEALGAGGMGEVYRVQDAEGVVRALKVLKPELAGVEELR